MNLPKDTKPDKLFEKICKCGNPFLGKKQNRYCPDCSPGRKRAWRESRKQALKTRKKEPPNLNIRLPGGKHTLYCALCGAPYEVIADNSGMHHNNIYPKFYEEHRNEYKRKLYEKNHGASEPAQIKTETDSAV